MELFLSLSETAPEQLYLYGAGVLLFFSWLFLLLSFRRRQHDKLIFTLQKEQLKNECLNLDMLADRLRHERTSLQKENKELCARVAGLEIVRLEAEKQERKLHKFIEENRHDLTREFRNMANRLFVEQNDIISKQHQSGLKSMLQPVRQQISEFKQKVEDVYDRESRDRVSISKEIEHLKNLNIQISEDAVNLTNALKGRNKIQGIWGEMVLEKLLEESGLRPGIEFLSQPSYQNKNGSLHRPDIVINLPEDRVLIIDSKVSLKNYEKACSAGTEKEQEHYLKLHLDSLKSHISSLGGKKYHLLEDIRSPDFVLLFLPIEGAFQACLTKDPKLTSRAIGKKVVLTSPSTLLVILRTINHLWRQNEQSRNSLAIAKQAGSLYDKFIGFLEAFEEVGYRLDQSLTSWNTAKKRLATGQGNILSRAEHLKTLGVQTEKSIPESVSVLPENQPAKTKTH